MTLIQYLILSSLIFSCGVFGVLSRRNGVLILMSVELMLNAVTLNFVVISQYYSSTAGNVFAIFIIALAAAEVAIGIAIFLKVFALLKTINIDEIENIDEIKYVDSNNLNSEVENN